MAQPLSIQQSPPTDQKFALEFSALCAKYHLPVPQALTLLQQYPWDVLKPCQYQSSRTTLCLGLCPVGHVFCTKHAAYANSNRNVIGIDPLKGEIRRYGYVPKLGAVQFIGCTSLSPTPEITGDEERAPSLT